MTEISRLRAVCNYQLRQNATAYILKKIAEYQQLKDDIAKSPSLQLAEQLECAKQQVDIIDKLKGNKNEDELVDEFVFTKAHVQVRHNNVQ